MVRVLRPSGSIVLTDLCSDFLICRIYDGVLRLVSPAHVKVYTLRECLQLLPHAGCTATGVDRYKVMRMWGQMTVRIRRVDAA
jgi:hypothetical protein